MLLCAEIRFASFSPIIKQEKNKGPYLCISSQELKELGGLQNIKAELPDWPVSDDTVLHLATAEGLATGECQRHLHLHATHALARPSSLSPRMDFARLIFKQNWLDRSDCRLGANKVSSGYARRKRLTQIYSLALICCTIMSRRKCLENGRSSTWPLLW